MIDVGVYFDLRNPAQWRQSPSRLYGFTIEACQEAERLGASSAWFSEHHLFDDDYLASPLTFAAAVAARTSRIRLGTAIVIAPLHHPAELAEQSVVVDLISDGRLDLGLGTGYRVPEFELYGASLKARYAQTDDTARQLRDCGNAYGQQPVQDRDADLDGLPRPAGRAPRGPAGGAAAVGRRVTVGPVLFRSGGGRSPARRLAAMAGGIQAWATDDPEGDWPMVSEHLGYQLDSYRRHMVEGTDAPTPKPVDVDRLVHSPRSGPLGSFTYGTPEAGGRRNSRLHCGRPCADGLPVGVDRRHDRRRRDAQYRHDLHSTRPAAAE